jgi:hypothetical protein
MGNETALYTLLRRHQNAMYLYIRLHDESKLDPEVKAFTADLLEDHRKKYAELESLLRDFSGSPVKPNKQTSLDEDPEVLDYPVRLEEKTSVYPYLRSIEESFITVYSEIAKRGNFPESVAEFMRKSGQSVMQNVNKLDFKVKSN